MNEAINDKQARALKIGRAVLDRFGPEIEHADGDINGGDLVETVVSAFHDHRPSVAEEYRRCASERYGEDGILEFAEDAPVSMSAARDGAYVQGWRYIERGELKPEEPGQEATP